ncbi:FecR family protein [Woodsholea maritima]|uniref:FecR family protein n=1 Tax=Woodsholea maritima TaxID=240237 RepID=UPI0014614654|nr:FecR domain-containing protein [Woodsholea maritima]
MSGNRTDNPTRNDLYDAALWSVRMHDLRADKATFDSVLKSKCQDDPAYAKVHQVWSDLGEAQFTSRVHVQRPLWSGWGFRLSEALFSPLVMRTGLALLACVVAVLWLVQLDKPQSYHTHIGEQREIALADGTLVTLNTNTAIEVAYSGAERRLDVIRGEAFFDVAHDEMRPFIVHAADSQIRALGTSFIVRREVDRVDVTLLSGIVEVTRGEEGVDRVALEPGDRLRRHIEHSSLAMDRPALDVVTAWKNGQLILKNTPLVEALAEMNRYSYRPIRLKGGALQDARLSGVFRVTEAHLFAQSLAEIYNLEISEESEALILEPRHTLQ